MANYEMRINSIQLQRMAQAQDFVKKLGDITLSAANITQNAGNIYLNAKKMYDTIREKEDPNAKKLEQLQKANALLREMTTNEQLTDNLNEFRANREATKNLKDLTRKQQALEIKKQEYEMTKETKKLVSKLETSSITLVVGRISSKLPNALILKL